MEQIAYKRSYDEQRDLITAVYRTFQGRCEELPEETRSKRRVSRLLYSIIKEQAPSHEDRIVLYHFFTDFFRAIEHGDETALAALKQYIA